MTATQWKNRIVSATKGVGTYRKEFDAPIAALAAILEKRDTVEKEWQMNPTTMTTYPNGTQAKNPVLCLWDDLNKSALAYWRDLGLTPAGLKKINETAMKPQKKSALSDALRGL